MKKILSAGIAALMLAAVVACGGNDDSSKKPSQPSTPTPSTPTPSTPAPSTPAPSTPEKDPNFTITYDFSGVETEAVQHSSYNVFDGVSVLTSTGVELKTRASATSNCTLNGKLLDTSEVRTCKIDYTVTFKYEGVNYTQEATRDVVIREAVVEEGNLVTNGNFELGLDHWELATHEGGTGELTLDRTDVMGSQKNAAKVVMSGLNWTNDSSPRLNSATYATGDVTKCFTMTGGQNYKVSFKAKALTTKYVNVSIGQLIRQDPYYEGFTSSEQTYKAEVTSEWKEFSYEFTATHATLEQCSILFSMGRVEPTADIITTLWFTDVYVGVYSGEVVDETAPSLGGLNDVTVTASSTPFNVLNGITANDNADGDISGNIVAKYNGNNVTTIDVATPGEYTISYEVSDAAGNKSTGSRKIIVVAAGSNLLAGVNAERFKSDSWCEAWLTQSFTDEADGSVKVHTIGIGNNSYENQINLNNLPCIGGVSYTLTFEVKTTVAFKVSFIQNQNPYTSYAEADIPVSNDFTTITLNINADQIDPVNKLTMELGLVGNDITFYIRNVNLVQN